MWFDSRSLYGSTSPHCILSQDLQQSTVYVWLEKICSPRADMSSVHCLLSGWDPLQHSRGGQFSNRNHHSSLYTLAGPETKYCVCMTRDMRIYAVQARIWEVFTVYCQSRNPYGNLGGSSSLIGTSTPRWTPSQDLEEGSVYPKWAKTSWTDSMPRDPSPRVHIKSYNCLWSRLTTINIYSIPAVKRRSPESVELVHVITSFPTQYRYSDPDILIGSGPYLK